MTCGPAVHDFAPDQIGQARLTKLGGADGIVASRLLETATVDSTPQLVVDLLTYTVRITTDNVGPINLDIGVRARDEPAPIWLVTDLVASDVDAATGWTLPQVVYAPLPADWPAAQDFQIIFRLQDRSPGETGYSAGFELGSCRIGVCPSAPAPSVRLGGRVQELFRDDFNGRAIDLSTWHIGHGDPYLLNCGLVLTTTRMPGVPSKAEVRSYRLFEPTSMLVISATTQNWQNENQEGDTSFGFESWYTHCHNAIVVTSNGQLGLIRPEEGADCSQPDPGTRECYQPIEDWEDLRREAQEFVIHWSPTQVTLSVNGLLRAAWDDQASTGCSIPAIPQVPLHVRLNANVFNEDREKLPGENHYDQDVLRVDYLYVPHGVALPVVLSNTETRP
jgi:hypothetical protein